MEEDWGLRVKDLPIYMYTTVLNAAVAHWTLHVVLKCPRQVGRDIFRDREYLSTADLLTVAVRRGWTEANDYTLFVIHLRTKEEAPSKCSSQRRQTFIQDDHPLGSGTPLAISVHCGVHTLFHRRGAPKQPCADKTWRTGESGHRLGSRLHDAAHGRN